MSKKRKTLTQGEIWDDTALIESWNEALEEYEYYHSLHARGEKVEDVLRNAEATGSQPDEETPDNYNDTDSYSDGEIAEDAAFDARVDGVAERDANAAEIEESESATRPAAAATATVLPSLGVPEMLAGGVQDGALRNLMMAWYYAGYYTGFHEGQQTQSRAQTQAPTPAEGRTG